MRLSPIKDCRPKSPIYLPYSPSTCRRSRIQTNDSAPPRGLSPGVVEDDEILVCEMFDPEHVLAGEVTAAWSE